MKMKPTKSVESFQVAFQLGKREGMGLCGLTLKGVVSV